MQLRLRADEEDAAVLCRPAGTALSPTQSWIARDPPRVIATTATTSAPRCTRLDRSRRPRRRTTSSKTSGPAGSVRIDRSSAASGVHRALASSASSSRVSPRAAAKACRARWSDVFTVPSLTRRTDADLGDVHAQVEAQDRDLTLRRGRFATAAPISSRSPESMTVRTSGRIASLARFPPVRAAAGFFNRFMATRVTRRRQRLISSPCRPPLPGPSQCSCTASSAAARFRHEGRSATRRRGGTRSPRTRGSRHRRAGGASFRSVRARAGGTGRHASRSSAYEPRAATPPRARHRSRAPLPEPLESSAMPSVRCPNCDTAQHVEAGSSGYTCSSCGRSGGSWSAAPAGRGSTRSRVRPRGRARDAACCRKRLGRAAAPPVGADDGRPRRP